MGTACYLSHNESVRTVASGASGIKHLRVRCVTGEGPDDAPDSWTDSDDVWTPSKLEMGTLFELIDPAATAYQPPEGSTSEENQMKRPSVAENVVARALIGYGDGVLGSQENLEGLQDNNCTGPTVEYMTVRRDYYGRFLAPILFDQIEKWFVETWTLDAIDECGEKARILKATQLRNTVVDQQPERSSGEDGRLVTDKMFLFKQNGFDVNVPNGGQLAVLAEDPEDSEDESYSVSHARPCDQRAIRWYPPAGAVVELPTRQGSKFRGRLVCDFCMTVEKDVN